MFDVLSQWDLQGFVLINESWRNAVLDEFLPMLSDDALFWSIVGVVLLSRMVLQGRGGLRRLPLAVVFLLLGLGASDLTANLAKNAIDRPRPVNSLPGVYYREHGRWDRNPEDFTPRRTGGSSFYSAHASNSMTVVTALTAFFPQAAPAVYLLPLGVGWSRMYNGKHYPSDILAGWLAGLVIGRLTGKAYRLTAERLRRRLRTKARNGYARREISTA